MSFADYVDDPADVWRQYCVLAAFAAVMFPLGAPTRRLTRDATHRGGGTGPARETARGSRGGAP